MTVLQRQFIFECHSTRRKLPFGPFVVDTVSLIIFLLNSNIRILSFHEALWPRNAWLAL